MNKLSKERLINIGLIVFIIFYILLCIYVGIKFDLKTALLLISIPLSILQFFYIKSEKAYMILSKYFLRPFFMAQNDWKFTGLLENVEKFSIPDIKTINEKFPTTFLQNIVIKKQGENKYKIDYDSGKIVFTVEYFPVKKKVSITTNKFTTTDLEYEKNLNIIHDVLEIIKSSIEGQLKESYDILIFYKENPYYGFYLKQIPKQFIKDFSIKLAIPSPNSVVKISKDKIQVSSRRFRDLEGTTKKVLELSEVP